MAQSGGGGGGGDNFLRTSPRGFSPRPSPVRSHVRDPTHHPDAVFPFEETNSPTPPFGRDGLNVEENLMFQFPGEKEISQQCEFVANQLRRFSMDFSQDESDGPERAHYENDDDSESTHYYSQVHPGTEAGDYEEIDETLSSLGSLSDFEISRSDLELREIIGTGQFGDVHLGFYRDPTGTRRRVAIKTCKQISDSKEKHLEEAYTMAHFRDHPYIINIYGWTSRSPFWIVMELAPLGGLRPYLVRTKDTLTLSTLLLFSYQLADALSYLADKKFVHRDIAARNVLVASEDCVKLSDFGLSRRVSDSPYYKSSKGKLPIKWMAPESISYRRFTHASDVWMFGVCVWEILIRASVKPFYSIKNHQVMSLLETGERLLKPSAETPEQLYELLCQMWEWEPAARPCMDKVRHFLHELYLQIQKQEEDENQGVGGGGSSKLYRYDDPTQSSDRKSSHPNHYVSNPCDSLSLDNPLITTQSTFNQSSSSSSSSSTNLRNFNDQEPTDNNKTSQSTQPSNITTTTTTGMQVVPNPVDQDSQDSVYLATTEVVRSVRQLFEAVTAKRVTNYVYLVESIGANLRNLLSTVDDLMASLPAAHHNRISMAHKLLSRTFAQLLAATKSAIEYSHTTIEYEYRKTLLERAHELVISTKNLYDEVDAARRPVALGAN